MSDQGKPCWYELTTREGQLDAVAAFYGNVFDWTVRSAGMEGFDYRLAGDARGAIAGLMALPEAEGPPNWKIYFTVEDADATAKAIASAGGRVLQGPDDIPDTGRFAVAADGDGAVFGILQPLPMSAAETAKFAPAFDQVADGRGHWHELMAADPVKAFDFYAGIFGWGKSQAMDMGEMGTYQLFSHAGADIGGIMGLCGAPSAYWLPYFGTPEIGAGMERVKANGGSVSFGPTEVPGGAWIAVCADPQGAAFAIVGPKA